MKKISEKELINEIEEWLVAKEKSNKNRRRLFRRIKNSTKKKPKVISNISHFLDE